MAESLFSESWYRVANVRPRLRNHAQIHRHVYRGSVWYVLQDHASGRFHRFTPVANLVIGLMNGERTMQQIWDIACRQLGDEVPSQGEMIKLMSDLHRADVLQSDAPPDIRELHERRGKHLKQKIKQYIGNPISLKFPLVDPDQMLQRLLPFARPLFGWFGAFLWTATVITALVLCAMHWKAFTNDMLDRVFSVDNVLLMWLLFPLVKILHELGHAFAVKVRGGEVHEMGVMLLLLVPIPYVDASAASAFEDKKWRMLVGAAGMLTELFIAAVAMIAWVYLEPGTERAIAYNIILITGISTLLFNGNPFLRYDGYYILADWLEIPNLAQRSNDYLGYLINRHIFKVQDVQSPVMAEGESRWFVFYSIVSFFYRMFMMITIVLLIASKFFLFGVLMALWSVYNMLIQPIAKKINYLFTSPRLHQKRTRAIGITLGTVLTVVFVLFVLPAPSYTRSEGVVWAPEEAQVRANVDGVITKVVAAPGRPVKKGDLLIECEDPELIARLAIQEAELSGLEARYTAALTSSRVQAEILQQQIAHARVAVDLAKKKLSDIEVRAPSSGTFIMGEVENMPGRFVQRGELLAYVTSAGQTTVRVVVPQVNADKVRGGLQSVEVRPVDNPATVIAAKVVREVPGATDQLPSMTLSYQGGGKIGLDPSAQGDAKTLQKLFVLDLQLPDDVHLDKLGSRLYVRFEHASEPIGQQWYTSARRVFLRTFNV
ncbi:efflux RND transporter periplasmic adaptor subunit [uncultured Oxalicibacterium sp.]|uniref:efflux RND transporter periplasmic adaptor subunit n=1 Tax=uncultured Oxalicibacterium sp. TaxID=1168540 RepID=UPI0025DF7B60|nr:efflux RND transporter periplasmic adaptor subunit [uncultured Oxalicibacterium sp.]